jgi:hypothetical protein
LTNKSTLELKKDLKKKNNTNSAVALPTVAVPTVVERIRTNKNDKKKKPNRKNDKVTEIYY